MWDLQKSQAREEQSVVEGLLRELHTHSRDTSDRRVLLEVESEIEQKISGLNTLIVQMAESARGSAARTAQVHRLRDLTGVWRAEVVRVRAAREREAARVQILGKKRGSVLDGAGELVAKERSHLLAAAGGAEESVSLAREAQRMIKEQTRRTLGAAEKLGRVAAKIPGVNGLMKKIQNKQFRDELVLATVIALGLFWVFWKLILAR